jgi:hypothetical protein
MNKYILFAVLVIAVFIAKLLWKNYFSVSAGDKSSTLSENEVSDYTDVMLVNSLKIAIGFFDRNVPRDSWESNLQGLREVLMNEGGWDEPNADFVINASRDLLNEHGDRPDLLRAMLDSAERRFPKDEASH